MKIIVLLCCAATAAAGAAGAASRPNAAYLPPAAARGPAARATILRQVQDVNEQGFHYAYETSDGTKAEQQGRATAGATPESGSLAVRGSYSYVGADGQTYSVTYTADENGYRAQGAHLPTPPPIPSAILESLPAARGSHSDDGQYTGEGARSSYDADSGYRY